MNIKQAILAVLLLSVAAVAESKASAETYEVDWFTIVNGGGVSNSGEYVLEGTIGQPNTGRSIGGEFSIAGGFWMVAAVLEPSEAPQLSVVRANQAVLIYWALTPQFQLERSSDLGDLPDWKTVTETPTTNNGIVSITLPISEKAEFFRLRR